MKRVRCPKCDQYITFDETKYTAGQSLVFKCPDCGKEFGIRIGVSKLRERQKDENPDEQANEEGCGSIVVIENVFHYKQVIPLRMGDNGTAKSAGKRARSKGLFLKAASHSPTMANLWHHNVNYWYGAPSHSYQLRAPNLRAGLHKPLPSTKT